MKRQIRHIMAILCIAIAVFMISVPAAAVGEAVDSDIEVSSETAENETSESKLGQLHLQSVLQRQPEQLQWVLQSARRQTEFQGSLKQQVIYVQILCLDLYSLKHLLYMH